MRRLPGILLLTGATLVVVVALLVSGLRLALPHLDHWRPEILNKIESATGVPVDASQLSASWQTFGPTLEARDIHADLKDGGEFSVKRVTLALDVWQSLLHMRWQFRDLTFWQLRFRTNTPIEPGDGGEGLEGSQLSDLFLRQFDHFDLRDSEVSFITLSGQRAELAIPQLTWLNDQARHRAEGQVSLSSLTGQHGVMQVRMDLQDNDGLLKDGRIWLQADDIDVKPWLGKWMQDNIALETAQFSLEGWMTIDDGDIIGGDIWLKKGGASWLGEGKTHTLSVDNLTAHITREQPGWQFSIPDTRITMDDKPWPSGALTLAWIPEQDVGGKNNQRSDELRIRASHLELAGLEGLRPLASKLSPALSEIWQATQPSGQINVLALDIPLQQTEKTRFQIDWRDLAWKQWKLLPGAEHFSGTLAGSVENASMTVSMKQAKMPYETVFRAPLEIEEGVATINWLKNDKGFQLDGRNIDVKATAVHAHGGFRYLQPANDEPWLGILAGISTDDGSQAWRYFPENLMGKELVDYLSSAIQGGQADNATLVYGGNPQNFPYENNDGQFEVLVPLRNAKFAFQPDWPALTNLDIELDFINDGLWMRSDKVNLGGVQASNLTAVIPDYSKEKLLIDADISGPGKAVGPYFDESPLKDSLGATLEQLQLDGNVNARLHLDIPLNGELVTAKGEVALKNNSLFIKPLDSKLDNLSGKFRFINGNLTSEPLTARWFNQPLNVDFTTNEGAKAYQVAVNLSGNWQPARTGVLPTQINDALSGSVTWDGKVGIELPYRAGATYDVELSGDMKNVSSHLPSPLEKSAGEPLPFTMNVKGNLQGFELTGLVGENNHFNSHWMLGERLSLERAIWASDSKTLPPLPEHSGVELNLPAMDGAEWLALFQQGVGNQVGNTTHFPEYITLRTPMLSLGGQRWNNLSIISEPSANGTVVEAQGREINASLAMHNNAPWLANIKYLYYNPSVAKSNGTSSPFAAANQISFQGWPDAQIRCQQCWFWGQKYGRIDGDIAINGNTLTLSNGLLDTGYARLTADGEWVNAPGNERTSIKGKLRGKKIDAAVEFFGVSTPIRNSSFNFEYDLHWRNPPWQPDEATLNGIIRTHLGKGELTDISTGHAGQLLRLLSVDALLRKLRFDFSDTFGEGFYYDSINSTAWIKDGVLHTDDTLVDGLEADIAMKGSVNLVQRKLNMEAVVAPEISATVGVAAAFAVNPIVGAAVFAASKVLGPLWSKVSILRYHISGTIDQPQINEVLRQPRKENQQ
ncbi:AsmA2 domain-containing protein YhdP [Escherichia fergusonii]|uniref:YhdP central domain-containing protein n=1 Tax=Escherichia fergusonii (strain ATCC 35469 / DSM 13698 / CCUG 18766 / IAM 14443 / JCM 21226 / LMG 7866 / NBRC 102419 / NCTC 12128 / CDC 0568-73) TaxID=585054 RepID=B7LRM0_ESCF3|nr:AsmA2 domain-containing protein YhdP [Escherichia fergusonii]EIH2135749.1 AsmA2 domain-containing protein YhdP [Escherichia fergusonii]EIH2155294.1 AsmA2 domain-containing protein YhdP [Escherichia fergusonii]EIH9409173.1 AsmA2 domain-containing protein YhdP [Escherichia fergusonii]EIH9431074.1 AsmA2 domain-containing protein YhdP [Escherichia fergusonii]NMW29878.1 AsmA2 domain-containing protein [Escherichia fergusonii]